MLQNIMVMHGSVKISLLAFIILLMNGTSLMYAQSAREHSDIVFRLANHVSWPAEAEAYKFIIGVVGTENDFMVFQQKAITQGTINHKAIEVRYFKCTDDIGQCDLVYVSDNCTLKLEDILRATRNEPILIVTGKEGYGQLGSVINFVESDGKVRIELNEKEANKRNLTFSSSLKALSISI